MKLGTTSRFLIVDDMKIMLKIYRKSLLGLGLEGECITDANDGQEAWGELEAAYDTDRSIEFVISDWNMPNLSGLDLLKKMRADERFRELPFLMITAENEAENIKLALSSGVDNFVAKPFKTEDLHDRIKSVIRKRNQ